jgi:hypothetical protein
VQYTYVYSTLATTNVSAGIGPFNVSYVLGGYPTYVNSFEFGGQLLDITNDPTTRFRKLPGDCPANSTLCYSYYFPGSLDTIYPPPNASDLSADVFIAPTIQGVAIDLWDLPISDIPNSGFTDCPIYTGPDSAFQVCIAALSEDNTFAISVPQAKKG